MIRTGIEFYAREYGSASEILAAAAERRRRLYESKPAASALKVADRLATIRARLDTRPEWMKRATYFNAHVVAYAPFRPTPFKKWHAYIKGRADNLGVSYEDLIGRSRKRKLVVFRQMIWLEMQRAGKSLPEISSFFDNRDHTTILHGVREAVKRENDEIYITRNCSLLP